MIKNFTNSATVFRITGVIIAKIGGKSKPQSGWIEAGVKQKPEITETQEDLSTINNFDGRFCIR